jgi:hypothetical protein
MKTGTKVINLSFINFELCAPGMFAALRAFRGGALVVAAGGNRGQEGNQIEFPAGYPHVLGISAIDRDDKPADFSSANAAIDLTAPGDKIPIAIPFDAENDGIAVGSGTSFSTPMVAGTAAWLISARGGLAAGQYVDLLRNSARDLGPRGWDKDTGYGLVNLDSALKAPIPRLDPNEPNDDIWAVDGRLFSKPSTRIWSGQRHSHLLQATIRSNDDPADVYRIRVPAHSNFTVTMSPTFGNPNLSVYAGTAKSIRQSPIAQSKRGSGKTEVLHLVNKSQHPRKGYVVVQQSPRSGLHEANYQLQIRRGR